MECLCLSQPTALPSSGGREGEWGLDPEGVCSGEAELEGVCSGGPEAEGVHCVGDVVGLP